jgi:RNA polymerase sigma factor (sigma-70 family)
MIGERVESAAASFRILMTEGTVSGLRDGTLLERFVAQCGEASDAAFEAIVARHGPVVFEACRSILARPEDAEDAFQATFLVLARRAATLRDPELLGPWLYGVALRSAREAKRRSARWRHRVKQDSERAQATENRFDESIDHESRTALHEEIGRLPDRYRNPIILCYFEGLTHADAAKRMACPEGTISVRLMRARERLRERLTRRGMALSLPLGSWESVPRPAWPALPQVLRPVLQGAAQSIAKDATRVENASAAKSIANVVLRGFLTRTLMRYVVLLGAVVLTLGGIAFARQAQVHTSDAKENTSNSATSEGGPREGGPLAQHESQGPGGGTSTSTPEVQVTQDVLVQERLDLELLQTEVSMRKSALDRALRSHLQIVLNDETGEGGKLGADAGFGGGNALTKEDYERAIKHQREEALKRYKVARDGYLNASKKLREARARIADLERRTGSARDDEPPGRPNAANPADGLADKSRRNEGSRATPSGSGRTTEDDTSTSVSELSRRLTEVESKLDRILEALAGGKDARKP